MIKSKDGVLEEYLEARAQKKQYELLEEIAKRLEKIEGMLEKIFRTGEIGIWRR